MKGFTRQEFLIAVQLNMAHTLRIGRIVVSVLKLKAPFEEMRLMWERFTRRLVLITVNASQQHTVK